MDQRALRLPGIIVATLAFSAISPLPAQTGAKNGEWRTYGADLGNTKYSPLDQINASNFNTLKLAGRFHTENLGPRPEYNMEDTPLMVGGVLHAIGKIERLMRTDESVDALIEVSTAALNPGMEGRFSPRFEPGWSNALIETVAAKVLDRISGRLAQCDTCWCITAPARYQNNR
jgi:hypothetical protein